MNLCIKKVKRAGHGYRCFDHYRLRVLLHPGGCNWDRYTTVKYRFIDSQKARVDPETDERVGYPIWLLCRVLEVPESSYYDWNAGGRARADERAARDEALTEEIRAPHASSDGTYGAPRSCVMVGWWSPSGGSLS
jgi:hypothetical protein